MNITNELLLSTKNWYQTVLLADKFPEAFSFWETLFSARARKQYFAEKRFLKEKKTQILCVTLALYLALIHMDRPPDSKSEIQKIVESIKEAMKMDPQFFKNNQDNQSVKNALLFLQKNDKAAK